MSCHEGANFLLLIVFALSYKASLIMFVEQDMVSCDFDDCVVCFEEVPSSVDCSVLDCSVISIDPVETEEYLINGKEQIRIEIM